METLHLDTHAVLWLYEGRIEAFSLKIKNWLNQKTLEISPMVLLELEYLFESKRITITGEKIFKQLQKDLELEVADHSFVEITQEAKGLKWTRDPFDRLIVAQAKLRKIPLLTKDRLIHQHYAHSVW